MFRHSFSPVETEQQLWDTTTPQSDTGRNFPTRAKVVPFPRGFPVKLKRDNNHSPVARGATVLIDGLVFVLVISLMKLELLRPLYSYRGIFLSQMPQIKKGFHR